MLCYVNHKIFQSDVIYRFQADLFLLKNNIFFPEISINFTLTEALHAIVYDMTFFEIEKKRKNQNKEINSR